MSIRQIIKAGTIVVIVTVACLEIALRPFRMDFAPLISVSHQPCIYVEDDRYGYRYEPNATGYIHRYFEMDNIVKTNNQGFHDVDRRPANELDAERILAIGDSFTAGLHVPTEDVWTSVLERLLNQSDPDMPVKVVNLGIDGTGTDIHELVLQDYLPRYMPETVILAFYENDVGDLERPKLYKKCHMGYTLIYQNDDQRLQLENYIDENNPNSVIRWLFDNSYTFRLPIIAIKNSRHRFNSLFLLDSNYVNPSAVGVNNWRWAAHPHNIDVHLLRMRELSDEYGFRLIIIPVPTKNAATESMEVLTSASSSEVLEQFEIVDVSADLKRILDDRGHQYDEMFWRYDGHFNSAGNEYFGRAVFRALQRIESASTTGSP